MSNDFEVMAKAPVVWWHKAECLMEAATVLSAEHQRAVQAAAHEIKESHQYELTPQRRQLLTRLRLPRVNMLLVGLAFENVAKGILIARNPDLVSSHELGKDLTGPHTRLTEWLTQAGVNLSDPMERDLVERLGEAVQWAAKYPTPTKEKFFTPRKVPDGGATTEPGNFLHSDPPVVSAIWARLTTEARAVVRK